MAQRVAGDLYESITGQLFEIGRQLRQPNGYPFDPVKLKKHLQDAIEGRFGSWSSNTCLFPVRVMNREVVVTRCSVYVWQVFTVVVDYSQSLAEMIRVSNYDEVSKEITDDHFPVKGEGRQEVEVVLFHFDTTVSTGLVIAEMDKAGYRPAMPAELLSLGAAQPELQRQFPIIALGQTWYQEYRQSDNLRLRSFAIFLTDELVNEDRRRLLSLHTFKHSFIRSYRFAAVHKSA